MQSAAHRLVEGNYASPAAFVEAAKRSAVGIAQNGATGGSYSVLGVWVDDSRRGVFMRLVRDHEFDIGQSLSWRPHKVFSLDKVADEGLHWLAQELGAYLNES